LGVGARARVRVGVGVGVRVRDAAHLGLVERHDALPALHLRAPPPEVVLQAAAPEPLEHEAQGVGRRVGVVQRADEARGDLARVRDRDRARVRVRRSADEVGATCCVVPLPLPLACCTVPLPSTPR